MSPIDHYYAVLDAYTAAAGIDHVTNAHPMAKHFAVLFQLARVAESNTIDYTIFSNLFEEA